MIISYGLKLTYATKYQCCLLLNGGIVSRTFIQWQSRRWLNNGGKDHLYYWNKVTVHHLKLCYFLMKNR